MMLYVTLCVDYVDCLPWFCWLLLRSWFPSAIHYKWPWNIHPCASSWKGQSTWTRNYRKFSETWKIRDVLLPSLAISCQRSLWLEAWMKLRSLAEGAQLATRHFLQQSAPVPCRSVGLASTPFRAVIFSSEEHWNVLEYLGIWTETGRFHDG